MDALVMIKGASGEVPETYPHRRYDEANIGHHFPADPNGWKLSVTENCHWQEGTSDHTSYATHHTAGRTPFGNHLRLP